MDARTAAGVLVIEETELDVVTSAAAEEAVVVSATVAFGIYAVVTSGNNACDCDESFYQIPNWGFIRNNNFFFSVFVSYLTRFEFTINTFATTRHTRMTH